MEWVPIVRLVIEAIIAIVGLLAGRGYLKKTYNDVLRELVQDAVLAAEKFAETGKLDKDSKKAYVKTFIRQQTKGKIDDQLLDFLIESAVKMLDNSKGGGDA